MFNCSNSLGFVQFVNLVTHSSMQSDIILDRIFSNDSTCTTPDSVTAPIGCSDHSAVNFSITVDAIDSCDLNNIELSSDTEAIELYVYDWSAGDYDAINNALTQFDWHALFSYYFDADSLWEHFNTRTTKISYHLELPKPSI